MSWMLSAHLTEIDGLTDQPDPRLVAKSVILARYLHDLTNSSFLSRREAMYAHHREVTEVADQLARCFCLMGQYKEAAQFLRACLPAIQER